MPGREPGPILAQSQCHENAFPAVKKLILLSVIIASIALPARAARSKDARVGLKKALIHVLIFYVIYMILLAQVWNRL